MERIVTSDSGCAGVEVIGIGFKCSQGETGDHVTGVFSSVTGRAMTGKILEGSGDDCRVVILLWNYGERYVLLYALLHAKVSKITFISLQHVEFDSRCIVKAGFLLSHPECRTRHFVESSHEFHSTC